MLEFFQKLFATDFMPHGYCLRQPGLIALDVLSDGLIAAAYFVIPVFLLRLVRKRSDLAYSWMFALFAGFILSCGATHVLGALTVWEPVYRFEALVKAITAAASILTAIMLARLIPEALLMTSPRQLKDEIAKRAAAETQVRLLNAQLEGRVAEGVTALTSATRKLAESERRQLLALEAAEMGTWFWDVQANKLSWDARCKKLFGLPENGEVTYQSFLSVVHPNDQSRIKSEVSACLESGQDYDVEFCVLLPDGSERWVRSKGAVERDGTGAVQSMLGVALDLTERKRMEQRIAYLAAIVESSEDAIIGKDLTGTITSWNSGAERMFGYSREEAVGKQISILSREWWRDEMREILARIRRGERIDHFETMRRRKDGSAVAVSLAVSPIRDASGTIVGASKIARDITERKRLDEALRASEQRFRVMTEAVPDMLFSTDMQGVLTFMSARFQEYVGFALEDVEATWVPRLILHPDDLEPTREHWEAALRTGERFDSEVRYRRADGIYRWFVVRAVPILDSSGGVGQWLGACTEVEQMKRVETALRNSKEELRQFAYAAAHDLQEPVRNVANAAGMLSAVWRNEVDAASSACLRDCIESAQRMHGMIKDLLAYTTAVEAIERDGSVTNMEDCLRDALENLKALLEETGGQVQFEKLPVLRVERPHMLSLFQNLIENALKYRRNDTAPLVKVSAVRNPEGWTFRVSDNGIGFKPEYGEQIFKVFKRLHTRSEYSGTGIGLAICARIVSHYGGRIWAEGKLGEGATFYFTLPEAEETR